MRMDWVPWTYILVLDFSECLAEDEGLKIMLEVSSHQAWGNVEYPLFLFFPTGQAFVRRQGNPKARNNSRHY